MIVAGWAWDDRLLLEVARSAQADAAILMLACGLLGLLFVALSAIGNWMDRRALRRDIERAHRPRVGSSFSKIEGRSRPADHPGSPHGPRHEPGAAMPRAALDLDREQA